MSGITDDSTVSRQFPASFVLQERGREIFSFNKEYNMVQLPLKIYINPILSP